MKKITVFLLAAALILSLCACGEPAAPAATASPADAATVIPQVSNEPHESEAPIADSAELSVLLDSIEGHASIGTEDDSLAAVQAAAKLMAWCTVTELELEEVRTEATNWLMDKGNDAQVAFAEKLRAVDEACKKIIAEDNTELLEAAGCSDCYYPWADVPYEKYIAIMEVVGVR